MSNKNSKIQSYLFRKKKKTSILSILSIIPGAVAIPFGEILLLSPSQELSSQSPTRKSIKLRDDNSLENEKIRKQSIKDLCTKSNNSDMQLSSNRRKTSLVHILKNPSSTRKISGNVLNIDTEENKKEIVKLPEFEERNSSTRSRTISNRRREAFGKSIKDIKINTDKDVIDQTNCIQIAPSLDRVNCNLNRLVLHADSYIKSLKKREQELTDTIVNNDAEKIKKNEKMFHGVHSDLREPQFIRRPISHESVYATNIGHNYSPSEFLPRDSIRNRHKLDNASANKNAIQYNSFNRRSQHKGKEREDNKKFKRNGTVWKAPGLYSKSKQPPGLASSNRLSNRKVLKDY